MITGGMATGIIMAAAGAGQGTGAGEENDF